MSIQTHSSLEQFKDVRNRLASILYDLSTVAAERNETIVDKQSVKFQLTKIPPDGRRPLAEMLQERVNNVMAKNAFKLAVVGEFNSGKSTLINALLEREILTSSWKPTTAARTILRYGEPERYRVAYLPHLDRAAFTRESNHLQRDLAGFTADPSKGNDVGLLSGDETSLGKEIKEVEVWCIADFLKEREIEIVDTPGLGSVFEAHKAVTYELIPSVDATVFLFPMDPGVGEEEILFLKYIREYVSHMFFVMTKADLVRDVQEQTERADYSRSTIEIKASIKVEQIYPVSAKLALEGQRDKSGFTAFLDALQSFLIASGGVARLQNPMQVARTQWANLNQAVGRDMQMLDQDLDTLRTELDRLKREADKIQQKQNNLLQEVDIRIQEMIGIATDGIDVLPMMLQQNVENTLNSYNLLKLAKADQALQVVMKDAVAQWLQNKEARFATSVEALQFRVDQALREILESLDPLVINVQERHAEIVDPMTSVSLASQLLGIFGGAAVKGTATSAAVIGGMFIAMHFGVLTILATLTWPLALALAGAIGTGVAGLDFLKIKDRLLKAAKDNLSSPLSNNKVNVYQAVVEGYLKDGEKIKGMRQNITDAFNQWGEELKTSTQSVIINLVDSRLTQLGARITEKESGKWDREKSRESYTTQLKALHEIEERLIQTETMVEELSKIQ